MMIGVEIRSGWKRERRDLEVVARNALESTEYKASEGQGGQNGSLYDKIPLCSALLWTARTSHACSTVGDSGLAWDFRRSNFAPALHSLV